jgi:Phosphotransferase enzyme family
MAPGVFPSGTPLLALPSWREPRLLLSKSSGPIRRWRDSAFYPATRWMARVYRLALRGKAVLGCGEARLAEADRWILPEFVGSCLPAVDSIVLQTRPPGPAQKFTIELRDRVGTIIGYVKYATEALAQRRLRDEHAMLVRLPPQLGPTPLKFGNMGDGTALLLTPLRGQDLTAKLPPAQEVLKFAKSLEISAPLTLAAHPFIHAVRERVGARLNTVVEDLAGRAWPIVFQHGDLAPWNLRWNPHSSGLCAFDWEFATANGFPYIDLAYFILQVALLVYSWPPVKSAIYATQWLERRSALGLTEREARALVRLAMFDAYSRGKDDEYPDDHPMQAWRLRIWRGLW